MDRKVTTIDLGLDSAKFFVVSIQLASSSNLHMWSWKAVEMILWRSNNTTIKQNESIQRLDEHNTSVNE